SEYAIVHTQNTGCYTASCPAQALSGEFGFYTWDGNNFTATSVSVDTDGPGGLYNAENPSDQLNESIQIAGAQLTFTGARDGPFGFNRVGAPTVSLVCGYESGWDDMLDQPLVFNSVEDYNEVRASCESQIGFYPFSTASLAGKTFYEEWNETRFVFDGNGTSAVVTDAGDDGILDNRSESVV